MHSVQAFYLEKTGIQSLICLCLIADVSFTRANFILVLFSLGSLCKRIYLQEGRHWTLICLCLIASLLFSSRYKFILNTLLLPPWVSVFTWRNGDTGALICLCLNAGVFFFSRYQFISNTLLLPPWVSVFTRRNGDTGALICLCLIASVFFPRVISSFRILFCCLLG